MIQCILSDALARGAGAESALAHGVDHALDSVCRVKIKLHRRTIPLRHHTIHPRGCIRKPLCDTVSIQVGGARASHIGVVHVCTRDVTHRMASAAHLGWIRLLIFRLPTGRPALLGLLFIFECVELGWAGLHPGQSFARSRVLTLEIHRLYSVSLDLFYANQRVYPPPPAG